MLYLLATKLLQFGFGFELMAGADEMFFLDDSRNMGNIVSYSRLEKMDCDLFKHQVFERWAQFPRMRSKVVKVAGKYFF